MTRQEFLDQVLAPLGRLTAQEREDVRRELEEHVEDRSVVLTYSRYGETASLEVPLPEQEETA